MAQFHTKIQPKLENTHKGYYFDVKDEEIKAHQKRSVEDIFNWLQSANSFISLVQTPTEKKRQELWGIECNTA